MGIQIRDRQGEEWTIRLDGVEHRPRQCVDDAGLKWPCEDEWMALTDLVSEWTCRPIRKERSGAVVATCQAAVFMGPMVDVSDYVRQAQAELVYRPHSDNRD